MSEIDPKRDDSDEFRWQMTGREPDEAPVFPVVKNLGPDPAAPGSDLIEVDGRAITG